MSTFGYRCPSLDNSKSEVTEMPYFLYFAGGLNRKFQVGACSRLMQIEKIDQGEFG